MLNPDFYRLRVFAAVYEHLSVSKAAEKLHVTPSAVSQALGQLEEDLSLRLFQRISRTIVPTEEAHEVFKSYKNCAQEMDSCIHNLKEKKATLSGTLRIGAPPEFGSRQLVQALAAFRAENQVRFELSFGLPDDLLKKVITQEIDFAVCDDGPYLKAFKKLLVSMEIFKEGAVLVASADFSKKLIRNDFSYAHLTSLPHCDYRPDNKVLRLWYEHHFGKSPEKLHCPLIASSVGSQVQGALTGLGLAFIPRYMIEDELRLKKLVLIPGKKKEYVNSILLVQKADKVPGKLEKAVITELKKRAPV